MAINENDFRGIDLNLLIAFMVLFREQSVSAAAGKLHLGQPAVSASLARLRQLFDDPLFIRSGQRMRPTSRAQQLHQSLLPLITQLQSAIFAADEFDPAHAQATLTLGMTDWVEVLLMPRLLPRLAQAAPGIRINIVKSDPFSDALQLENGGLDMAVSVALPRQPHINRAAIASMNFVTLWHPNQLALEAPLSLRQYAALPQLMVSYQSAQRSQIDALLEEQGLARQVIYTTPHFSAIPGLLQNMPVIATVPAELGALWQRQFAFSSCQVALAIPDFELSLLWHERNNSHAALMWLKALLLET
jgi:DNA-binding transcriptional LysR family regulator